jgi:hypothetical protein
MKHATRIKAMKAIETKRKKIKAKDLIEAIPSSEAEILSKNEIYGRLTAIQRDVNELMPQMVQEIDEGFKGGGGFSGIKSEKKLWPRFLHSYASSMGNLSKACDFCGISRNHYYRARKRYPTLDLLLAIIDERYMDTVEEATKRHALQPRSIVERIFLLKNLRKAKYADDDKSLAPVAVQVNFSHLGSMRDNPKEINIHDNPKPIGTNDGSQEDIQGSDRLSTSSPTREVPQK